MKNCVLVMTLIVVASVAYSQEKPQDPTAKIIQNLSRIESLYFKSLSSRERQDAIKLVNETRNLIVGNSSVTTNNPNPNVQNILNDDGFLSLLSGVGNESSDDRKTTIILSIGKNGKITCEQLSKLIALYKFDSYREKLLTTIADNIIDPVNIGSVLKFIESSSTRRELTEYFKNR